MSASTGDWLSSISFPGSDGTNSWDCWGAELGPQAPLIHVDTPKRGRIQSCRANQIAKTPKTAKISMLIFPFFDFIIRDLSSR
jgi:hypothetical protein